MLKRFVKNLEDVEDQFRGAYKKVNGGYRLDAEFADDPTDDDSSDDGEDVDDGEGGGQNAIARLKAKIKQMRKTNERLMREKDAVEDRFRDVDPEVVQRARAMEEKARNAEERELMRQGKWDEVFERRDARAKQQLAEIEAKLVKERDVFKAKYEASQKSIFQDRVKARIADAISASKLKFRPEAMPDVFARAYQTFVGLDDDGELVAMDGDERRMADEQNEYSPLHFVQELISSAPHFLVEAQGAELGDRSGRRSRIYGGKPVVEIDPDDPNAFGANLEDIASGKVSVRTTKTA